MITQESVKDRILEAIGQEGIRDFYSQEFEGYDLEHNVPCPLAETRHEGGTDEHSSFSVDLQTGAFNCFACGFKGTSIIGYYTDVHCAGNFKKALAVLFKKYVGNVVSASEVLHYHKELLRRKAVLRQLQLKRRWSEETIRKLKLGWDNESRRLVIPVFSGGGFVTRLLKHDAIYAANRGHAGPKTIAPKGIKGSDCFYPLTSTVAPFAVGQQSVWVTEGEPDAISLVEEGINGVTYTGGVDSLINMPTSSLMAFQGKHVVVCLDNDTAGRAGAKKLAGRLCGIDIASLKVVFPPQGKDVNDYFVKHGGSGELLRQWAASEDYLIKPRSSVTQAIPLHLSSDARYIGKSIVCDVIVNGKNRAPYVIPKRLDYSCKKQEGGCSHCPSNFPTGVGEHVILKDDPVVLDWIDLEPIRALKKELQLSPRCPISVNVKEWQTVEQVSVIPALSLSASQDVDKYCQRVGFFLGHGIETNSAYRITALPVPLPKTNESVLLITDKTSTYDNIEGFTLSEEDISALKELMTGKRPGKILREIADMLTHNVTKIYDRWDLHVAVDLAFHSIADFDFCGVRLPKGSIELLLFGDTRCGKGQVAEGLSRYYDLGSVVSGESCSFMGLLGGAQQVGGSFQLTWGAIPINNKRLVVIDEFSGLGSTEMGRLSRIRSEGIAELHKGGIQASTRANARLIWIANPKGGKPVSSFSSGAQAIEKLVNAQEDMARFDLAFVVQRDEVPASVINRRHNEVQTKYTKDILRKLLLWTWSRKNNQVLFTDEATSYILDRSQKIAQRYKSSIPLVQAENVRFKLAKLAAAVAARVFSSKDGKTLRVTSEHVRTAIKFLIHCYDKPSMGYRTAASLEHRSSRLQSPDTIRAWLSQFDGSTRTLLVNGLLEADYLSIRDFEDWTDHSSERCKKHISLLVRQHCIKQIGRGQYIKRPDFIKLLKESR